MDRLLLPLTLPPRIVAAWTHAEHRGEERYRLRRFWCLNLYQGHGELRLRGQAMPIMPGSASITPPDTDHAYAYRGRAILTWIHFIPDPAAASAPIAVMRHLGAGFAGIHADALAVAQAQDAEPARACALLWALLWRLADGPAAARPPVPTAVRLVQAHAEARIGEALSAAGLARVAGLSPTHLTRLFRAATGQAPMAWVRGRRIAHAVHLLRDTRMPVRAIAAQLGFADALHLNKALHRATGMAPRQHRQGG